MSKSTHHSSNHIDEDRFGEAEARIDNLLLAAGALADRYVNDREAQAFHVLFRAIDNALDEIEAIVFPGLVTRSGKVAPQPEPSPAPPIEADLREKLSEQSARISDLVDVLWQQFEKDDSRRTLVDCIDHEVCKLSALVSPEPEATGGRNHG